MGPFWTFLMISTYLDVFGTLNHFIDENQKNSSKSKIIGGILFYVNQYVLSDFTNTELEVGVPHWEFPHWEFPGNSGF